MPFLLLATAVIIITGVKMKPWQFCLLFGGCAVFLPTCAGAEKENFVRISPEKPVVEYGGSVVLNCSSNCEKIGLETTLKQVPAGDGINWKAFNLTNVDQWDVAPLCYARCATGTVKPHRANITVYHAPQSVILHPAPKMEVGKEYNLTCRVPSVAPLRNLTVTLSKGGKALLVKTFENDAAREAREVVVTHAITVRKEDQGEEVTCQATLDLRPEGPLIEKAALSESQPPVGTAEEVFKVTLSPQVATVKQGGSVWLNCSSTCESSSSVALETSLQRERVLRGPGWESTLFQNITERESHAHCYHICDGKRKIATATVLTYGPPEHVFIELEKSSPSQSFRQAYNLTCRVINMLPVHSFSVTLMKGTKRVHSWRLQNYTLSGPGSFNITHAIDLRPHDHGQEAACKVTLDLSTEEQTFTSPKLELKTPETYRGVIVATSVIGTLVTLLMGIFIYYLVSARRSPLSEEPAPAKQDQDG